MDATVRAALERRIGRAHLEQRLGVEEHHSAQVFGQGLTCFHIENLLLLHLALGAALRVAGLYRRGRRNAARPVVERVGWRFRRLPAAFDGYTLLHLSDLHLDADELVAEATLRAVRDLRYDACVLTGDYRALTFGPFDRVTAGMRRLRKALAGPVFAVLGNHDELAFAPALEALGMRVLLNEAVRLTRGDASLCIAGVDDAHYYRCDNLQKAAEAAGPDTFTVLLSHSPEIGRSASFLGMDLMLCGHTHGGQICLPGGFAPILNTRGPRRCARGRWRYRGLQGYTSRGAGVSAVGVRFGCPPELTLHTLHCGPPARRTGAGRPAVPPGA